MPGPEPRFRNPVGYSMRMEKRELALLRKLAARRNRAVSQLIRDAVQPLIDEAEAKFGRAVPGRPQ